MVNRRSGCAPCMVATTYSPPSPPAGWPGSGSWSRKSGATSRASRPGRPRESRPRRRGGSAPCWRRALIAAPPPRPGRTARRGRARRRRSRAAGGRSATRPSPVTSLLTPCRACAKIATICSATKAGSAGLDHRVARVLVGDVDELDVAARRGRELGRHVRVGDRRGAGEDERPVAWAGVVSSTRRRRRRRAGRSWRSARRRPARRSRPSCATCAAAASTFDMKKLERRTTAETRRPRRCSSTWPCQSQNATGAPGAAVIDESLTMRADARATAASIVAVSHATRHGSSAPERNSASAPSSASRTDGGRRSRRPRSRPLAEERARPLGIAREHAHLLVLPQQRAHDVRARAAGCSSDEDHCLAPLRLNAINYVP